MKRDSASNEDLLQLHRDNRRLWDMQYAEIQRLNQRFESLEKFLDVYAEYLPPSSPGYKHTKIKKAK